jgi:hypothetical protein
MNKPSRNSLFPVFSLLTLFIFGLLLSDYDTCSPVNPVCPQDITYIELVLETESPGIPQIHDDSPFNNPVEKQVPFFSNHTSNSQINPIRLRSFQEINCIINRHLNFPSCCIIPILQKKNHWHQSSDDDTSPLIYS